jgi:hypothetical protein
MTDKELQKLYKRSKTNGPRDLEADCQSLKMTSYPKPMTASAQMSNINAKHTYTLDKNVPGVLHTEECSTINAYHADGKDS